MNRRDALKSLAGLAMAGALPSSLVEIAQSANPEKSINPKSINPSWYGFNLLEYFSTDPDWMKHFPYVNDGQFQESDFVWIRDWGFNWVRLPMDYRFWTDPKDLMKINEKNVEPIDRAIRLGDKYDVHVNICLHRAPGECILDPMNAAVTGIHVVEEKASVYSDPAMLDAFVYQWEYFAKRYKGIPSAKLSFNLVNEPDERSKTAEVGVKDYVRVASASIKAIRAIDPDRLIVSDGYPNAQQPVMELADTKVLQSAHDYNPAPLTHFRVPWARPMSDQVPLPTWPLKDKNGKVISDKQTIRAAFSSWGELAQRDVPIHFGEMGCGGHTPPDVVYAWYNDTLDVIGELNSGWALWNFRGQFGILDTERPGVEFQDWHGHTLDGKLLKLLQSKMKS